MALTIIVGSGRCGSTMLSYMLHKHPQILSLSEVWNLFPNRDINILSSSITGDEFWRVIATPSHAADGILVAGIPLEEYFYPYERARFDPATGVPSICRVLGAISDDPDVLYDKLAGEVPSWPRRMVAGHCRVLFAELAAMLGRPVIVERTGASLNMIRVLRRRFPDARFIFLHRNGPDCALSMSRHPLFRISAMRMLADALSKASLPEMLSEEMLPEEVRTVKPKELLKISFAPFDAERFMKFPIPVAFFAWMWATAMREGGSAIREVWRDDWITLRYEQLLSDTRGELTRLADFIGIPAERQWLDEANDLVDPGRAGSAAARLDRGELAVLEEICAEGTLTFDLLEAERAVSAQTTLRAG